MLAAIVVFVLLIAAAVGVYTVFGFYNVAASRSEPAAVAWWLDRTMESSVRRHADGSVPFPPALDDPALIRTGAEHYVHEGCIQCHAGVGVPRAEFARGMRPQPPELARAAAEWDDRELYWIMQNGIALTGMPAFGATHDPEELWAMVAFVRLLPQMSEAEFRELTPSTGGEGGGEGHHPGGAAQGGEGGHADSGEGAGHAHGGEEAGHAHDGEEGGHADQTGDGGTPPAAVGEDDGG